MKSAKNSLKNIGRKVPFEILARMLLMIFCPKKLWGGGAFSELGKNYLFSEEQLKSGNQLLYQKIRNLKYLYGPYHLFHSFFCDEGFSISHTLSRFLSITNSIHLLMGSLRPGFMLNIYLHLCKYAHNFTRKYCRWYFEDFLSISIFWQMNFFFKNRDKTLLKIPIHYKKYWTNNFSSN